MKPGIFNPPAAGGGQATITTTQDFLASDVACAILNTFADGPSHALAAGTYYVSAMVQMHIGATLGTFTVRIWDGTTIYLECDTQASTINTDIAVDLVGIITLSGAATLKVSAAPNVANTNGAIKANPLNNAGATNKATHLDTLKLS